MGRLSALEWKISWWQGGYQTHLSTLALRATRKGLPHWSPPRRLYFKGGLQLHEAPSASAKRNYDLGEKVGGNWAGREEAAIRLLPRERMTYYLVPMYSMYEAAMGSLWTR